MKNIKPFNSPWQNIAKRKGNLLRLPDLISEYPSWLIKNVKSFLNSGKLISLKNGDIGCYDAEIIENEERLFVEVNLDIDSHFLEDCHCTCNTGFCNHLAAVIWKINEDKRLQGQKLYLILKPYVIDFLLQNNEADTLAQKENA